VSYAKRHVGRQMVGGQQTTMPLKINMGGVIPVIFASSVLSMPQSLLAAIPADPAKPEALWYKVQAFFATFHASDPYYELIFLTLILFFTFFCVIVFNVEEVAITWETWRLCRAFAGARRPDSTLY
jgi:preprotein translocase subunit SecY